MSKLRELLAAFPEYWSTDDESVPLLKFTYQGNSCWVKIEEDVLEIVPSGGPRIFVLLDQVNPEERTLLPVQLTITQLIAMLTTPTLPTYVANLDIAIIESNFHHFSDGTVVPHDLDNIWRLYPNIWTNYPLPGGIAQAEDINGDGTVDTIGWYLNVPGADRPLMVPGIPTSVGDLAAVILTETNQDIVQNQYLKAPTNLLWQLLKPIARTLREGQEYGDLILKQTDLRNVNGAWLDRWGEIYGVGRIVPENDDDFRRRLVSTTFKPRISPTSIEKALVDPFGFMSAEVSDDSDTAFRFKVKFEATHNKAHFFGQHTREVIDLYRAAGTTFLQEGHALVPLADVPAPLSAVRLRKYYADDSWEGYSQGFDDIWKTDQSRIARDTGSTAHLFSGKPFGGGLFG